MAIDMHMLMGKMRFRRQGYQDIFGVPGTAGHDAIADLARYCHVFDMKAHDHDTALIALGLRRAFMHMWQYLHLQPDELAVLYRDHVLNQGDE
jgi:hypothetical protein